MPDKQFETVVCANHYDNLKPIYTNEQTLTKEKI